MKTMRVYEFMLATEPDLDKTDRLYGYFGEDGAAPESVHDFTLVTQSGIPIANCTVEATSFEAALELVLPKLREEGLQVVRVEVDEVGLALLQEAI
ncbi:MAG: hypothetical protein F4Y79_01135 [Gemmatimonadetes bacterium]|nr:hypothetical protein [Gemmatimonadota bacterium]MYF18688.1 hypothetical protein [Gemmatimonadota bacterium]